MQAAKRFILTSGTVLLASLAILFAAHKMWRFHGDGEAEARVWFYDQKAQRLYPAPRDLIPPDGGDDNRVRAIVIGFQGMGNDPSHLQIAYLEKYNPELKGLLQRAQTAHSAKKLFTEKIPSASSAFMRDNTLVKRPGEPGWHALSEAGAQEIVNEWRAWHGPQGQPPVVSVPSS